MDSSEAKAVIKGHDRRVYSIDTLPFLKVPVTLHFGLRLSHRAWSGLGKARFERFMIDRRRKTWFIAIARAYQLGRMLMSDKRLKHIVDAYEVGPRLLGNAVEHGDTLRTAPITSVRRVAAT